MNAETKTLLEWKWKIDCVKTNLEPLKMHYAFIIVLLLFVLLYCYICKHISYYNLDLKVSCLCKMFIFLL